MKAMILAAGRGERLRPLTDQVPKPLVEAGGKPLLGWHLERLARAGVRACVINTSHLGAQIRDYCSRHNAGLEIAFSEEAEALETAGGIAAARALLGAAPFLLVNGDVYCEIDLGALRAIDLANDLAHLILVPNPPHRPEGDFTLLGDRIGAANGARHTYAGIAVVDPMLVAAVSSGEKAPLAPYLHAAAGQGRLGGRLYTGPWHDVGTLERLAKLEAHLKPAHGA